MSLNVNQDLHRLFERDVESIEDFTNRVRKIKEYVEKYKQENWGMFFRGDKFYTHVQSSFFRNGNISDESKIFKKWKQLNSEICKEHPNEFEQLSYMQHYCGNTRLLDFTTDELVALRFACGRQDENCRKKITIYITDCLGLDSPERDSVLNSYLKLINDVPPTEFDEAQWKRDVFVRINPTFHRIEKQCGLFLLMGNFTTEELVSCVEPKVHNEKVMHELSPSIGRGNAYPGYTCVLGIAAKSVEGIRKELEQTKLYNMDFLMGQDPCVN